VRTAFDEYTRDLLRQSALVAPPALPNGPPPELPENKAEKSTTGRPKPINPKQAAKELARAAKRKKLAFGGAPKAVKTIPMKLDVEQNYWDALAKAEEKHELTRVAQASAPMGMSPIFDPDVEVTCAESIQTVRDKLLSVVNGVVGLKPRFTRRMPGKSWVLYMHAPNGLFPKGQAPKKPSTWRWAWQSELIRMVGLHSLVVPDSLKHTWEVERDQRPFPDKIGVVNQPARLMAATYVVAWAPKCCAPENGDIVDTTKSECKKYHSPIIATSKTIVFSYATVMDMTIPKFHATSADNAMVYERLERLIHTSTNTNLGGAEATVSSSNVHADTLLVSYMMVIAARQAAGNFLSPRLDTVMYLPALKEPARHMAV